MGEYITLMGADDVRSAGYKMIEAAQAMNGAANIISEALMRLEYTLQQHEINMQQILDQLKETLLGFAEEMNNA